MKGEVDSLRADKYWRFFQLDTIILGVCDLACPNYYSLQHTESNKSAMSLQYLEKEVMNRVYFGAHQDQNSY